VPKKGYLEIEGFYWGIWSRKGLFPSDLPDEQYTENKIGRKNMKTCRLMLLAAVFMVGTSAFAKDPARNNYIPTTISAQAQKVLTTIYAGKGYERKVPAVDDMGGWRKEHAALEQASKAKNDKAVDVSKVTVADAGYSSQ
jgi:hypothetical protein